MSQECKKKVGKQCHHCPWKKSVDPYTIPNKYSKQKHMDLIKTISEGDESIGNRYVMTCHETEEEYSSLNPQ